MRKRLRTRLASTRIRSGHGACSPDGRGGFMRELTGRIRSRLTSAAAVAHATRQLLLAVCDAHGVDAGDLAHVILFVGSGVDAAVAERTARAVLESSRYGDERMAALARTFGWFVSPEVHTRALPTSEAALDLRVSAVCVDPDAFDDEPVDLEVDVELVTLDPEDRADDPPPSSRRPVPGVLSHEHGTARQRPLSRSRRAR